MAQGSQKTDHVWLVMIKAMHALTRYAAAWIEGTGLGNSDFRVLEVLLHKGPLPVNTIGPISSFGESMELTTYEKQRQRKLEIGFLVRRCGFLSGMATTGPRWKRSRKP